MPLKTITKFSVVRNLLNKGIDNSLKAFEASRKASEYIFIILKLVAGIALFGIVLTVVYQAFQDHGKISVKPFSVPEAMQKNHKAAGSIIANIIKQDLAATRINIDEILHKDSEKSVRRETLVSHDTGFFKGANIKLPETGITINDVVEFISGLFGRQTITGSIYADNGYLYLQVEISGKIFTTKEALPKENEASLHIDIVERMAHKASSNILQFTSEKYRLYYYCLEEQATSPEFDNNEYHALSEYCKRYIERRNSDDARALQVEMDEQKKELHAASDMERYVINLLSNKFQKPAAAPPQIVANVQTMSLAEEVQQMIKQKTSQALPKPKPSPKAPSDLLALNERETTPPPTATDQRLVGSELIQLQQECENTDPNTTLSNSLERDASIDYNDGNFILAKNTYIQAIKANCKNSFAWANLGILLSDLKNEINFNASEAVVALQIGASIKKDAGWMWHSLCVAQVYAEDKHLEQAINLEACRKARTVQPGKQLIYDKLLYTAIADKYKQLGDFDKAFQNYNLALSIDPKRTCRLKGIVDSMVSIRDKVGETKSDKAICQGLQASYPIDDPDLVCEEALKEHESNCN